MTMRKGNLKWRLKQAVLLGAMLVIGGSFCGRVYANTADPVTDIILDVNALPARGVIMTPAETSCVRVLPDEEAPNETVYMMGISYPAGAFADKYWDYDESQVTYNVGNYQSVQFTIGHMDSKSRSDMQLKIYLDEKEYKTVELNGTMVNHLVTVDVSGAEKLRINWKGFYGLGNVYGFMESAESLQPEGRQAPSPTVSTRVRTVSYRDLGAGVQTMDGDTVQTFERTCSQEYPLEDRPLERITMMGIDYAQGVSADKYWNYDETDASWNIGGRYDTLQFVVGHLDGSSESDATLTICLDEKNYGEIPLTGTMMNQLVTIDVSDITRVRLSWKGYYGLGNVVFANTEEFDTDTDGYDADGYDADTDEPGLEPGEDQDEEPTAPCLKPGEDAAFQPGTTADETAEETEDDSACDAASGSTRITPYTSTGAQAYPVEDRPNEKFYMMGIGFAQGAAADKYWTYDISEVSYNIGGRYSAMQFTVGHLDDANQDESVLEVYLDEQLFQEIPLTGNMMNRDLSLDVTGITKVRLHWKGFYGVGNVICR